MTSNAWTLCYWTNLWRAVGSEISRGHLYLLQYGAACICARFQIPSSRALSLHFFNRFIMLNFEFDIKNCKNLLDRRKLLTVKQIIEKSELEACGAVWTVPSICKALKDWSISPLHFIGSIVWGRFRRWKKNGKNNNDVEGRKASRFTRNHCRWFA